MGANLYFLELTVADCPAAVSWYERVLGLEVEVRDEGFALLRAGGVRLALKAGEPRPGGVLLAWEVEGLQGWVERLRGCGVEPEGEVKVSTEGYRRVRLRDLDGYGLCLFEWDAAKGR